MATNSEIKELYRPPNGTLFLIDSIPGVRDYSQREHISPDIATDINNNDKIIRVTAKNYWYKTDDLGRMIYHLLMNKRMLSARQAEADKLYKWIRRCFVEAEKGS